MLSIQLVFVVYTIKVVNTLFKCDFTAYELRCDEKTKSICNYVINSCNCRPEYNIKLQNDICLRWNNIEDECGIFQDCTHILDPKCLKDFSTSVPDSEPRNKKFLKRKTSVKRWAQQQHKISSDCNCRKSHQFYIDKNRCVYQVIGKACSYDIQCLNLISNSECDSGVCNCQISHYHYNGSCLLKKNYDDFCSNSFECKTNLYCSQTSQCKCRKYYEFNEQNSECLYKSNNQLNLLTHSKGNLWDEIVKVGGFVIIVVVMLFLCTKKESEQNQPLNNSNVRRRSTSTSRAHRRTSSVNSHRPLTATSSNTSRSSAYRTFEENRQTIIIPMPIQMVRTLSSSDEEIEYNPYLFDTLFPQQSDNDNDDPPSYEDVIKEMDNH